MKIHPDQIYDKSDIGAADVAISYNPKGQVENLRLVDRHAWNDGSTLKGFANPYGVSTSTYQFQPQTLAQSSEQPPVNANPGISQPVTTEPTNPGDNTSTTAPPSASVADAVSATTPGEKTTAPTPSPPTDYGTFAEYTYNNSPVHGWTIDRSLTNQEVTTYVGNDGKVVIAFSGTKFGHGIGTAFRDMKADAYINTGEEQNSAEFQRAVAFSRNVATKYGIQNLSVCGHSLGGTKAAFVSSNLGIPAFAYNAGWSGEEFQHYRWNVSKVRWFNIWGDPISVLQYSDKNLPKQNRRTFATYASKELQRFFIEIGIEAIAAIAIYLTDGKASRNGYQALATEDPELEQQVAKASEKTGIAGWFARLQAFEQQISIIYVMTKTHNVKEFNGIATARTS
jgi:hypothetical protein